MTDVKSLLITAGAWRHPQIGKAFENRGALAGLWISGKNSCGVSRNLYRRAWPFHGLLKPFVHFAPQNLEEKMFYNFFPVWKAWVKSQKFPEANVVHAVMGFATEAFDIADKLGALKVIDCPNSNPTTYFGFWQRECDLWCPGEKVPIPRWMFARMNRELERADLVLVLSDFCKETMVRNGIPASKVVVIYPGVDVAIFRKRVVPPIKPVFVNVGTICLRKGHQYLFRAFELVKKELPEAELICIGGYKSDFRLERMRWEGSFTHYPFLAQDKISTILQEATAFVFPSQEEGIGRAQIEALASGLPVIGTEPGGTATVVEHGKEGFIVSSKNPRQLADSMIALATNRDLNAKMGEAAYRKGALSNTWQDYGDRLLATIQTRLEIFRRLTISTIFISCANDNSVFLA